MPLTPCPDDASLRCLLAGRLTPAEAVPLEDHLAHCTLCAGRADTLDTPDDLLGLMRGHAPATGAERDALALAAERAAAYRPGTSPSFGGATLGDGPTPPSPPSLGTVELPGDLAEALSPPVLPDEIGRLGQYRVLGVLGVGGMGVVFLAERASLPRQVAVKVIHPDLAARPEARLRFLREARALAALDHPHVVPLYAAGEENGLLYLEMPLLRGETLRDRLLRGRLPAAEAARVGRQAAEGLAAAHAAGLMHRDLKPGNVWLGGGEGCPVRLFDFGLARAKDLGGEPGLTTEGTMLGTPGYLSPEQARGEPADARSDLFALGCVLYEACTGEGPFRGESARAELEAVECRRPRPPHRVAAGVPRGLSDLVMSLLEKAPGDRPASAADVAEALSRLEAGRATEPPARPAGRRRRAWPVAALVLASALLGWGLGRLGPPGEPVTPDDRPAILTESETGARRSSVEGEQFPPARTLSALVKIMSPNITPRIRIEDLPALEALTEEEMAQVFGAGKFNRARLDIETLEGREMLAAQLTASLSGGVLRVEGTPGNDLIRILQNDGLISVEGIGIQSGGANLPNVSAAAVQQVFVEGLDGNDQISLGDSIQVLSPRLEVQPGAGADVINFRGTSVGDPDGLFQMSPTAVYKFAGGRLTLRRGESTWQDIGIADKVVVDKNGKVFYTEGPWLLWANPDNAHGYDGSLQQVIDIFQGKDQAGNPVAYVYQVANGEKRLFQSGPPNHGGRDIGSADKVVVDKSGKVFYTEGPWVLWANPDNPNGYEGIAPGHQGLFQARDAAGQPVVYLLQDRALKQYNGGTWVLVSDSADQVTVDRTGALFALSSDGHLWLRSASSGSGWVEAASNVTHVLTDRTGALFARSSDGHLWLRSASSGSGWVEAASNVTHVLTDRTGALFALSSDGHLWLRSASSGSGWVEAASGVKEMALTDRGLYLLRKGDKVDFVNPDGSLTNELGSIRDIAVAGGQLYALTTSGNLLHHLGGVNNYRKIDSLVASMSVGADGKLQVTHTPVGKEWHRLGSPGGVLGQPKSLEVSIPGGTMVEFEHGAIGHGPRGTFAVSGDVWTQYRNNKRVLGVPTANEQITETGKRFQGFENGLVFANLLEVSRGNYYYVLSFANNYDGTFLDELGLRGVFRFGNTLFIGASSASCDTFRVTRAANNRLLVTGGSRFFPTTQDGIGSSQVFAHFIDNASSVSQIFFFGRGENDVFINKTKIRSLASGAMDDLGVPTSDWMTAGDGWWRQDFPKGGMFTNGTKTFVVVGRAWVKYREREAEGRGLGRPTTNLFPLKDGSYRQNFSRPATIYVIGNLVGIVGEFEE